MWVERELGWPRGALCAWSDMMLSVVVSDKVSRQANNPRSEFLRLSQLDDEWASFPLTTWAS
jgi:hypothetical protein